MCVGVSICVCLGVSFGICACVSTYMFKCVRVCSYIYIYICGCCTVPMISIRIIFFNYSKLVRLRIV